MRRFLFWFVVGMIAIGIVRSSHHTHRSEGPRTIVIKESSARTASAESGRKILVLERDGKKVVAIDARGGVQVTSDDDDVDDEHIHHLESQIHQHEQAIEEQTRRLETQARELQRRNTQRIFVDGLPVPVVPGTLTTEARPEPPQPPAPPKPPRAPRAARRPQPPQPPQPPVPPAKMELVSISGRRSATESRAREDARVTLVSRVTDWLEPDAPKTWQVPGQLIDGLIKEVRITPVERDYGTVYEATLRADLSPQRRSEILEAYRRETTIQRLGFLGAGLAFALVCLATLSGYIRADEATKGYYTNRLRLAAAAGVGAAGVAIYQWLA